MPNPPHSVRERLVVGSGQYIDDIEFPEMAHAAFLRSPYAHALIKSISLDTVSSHQGVLLALDGTRIASMLRPIPVPVHIPPMVVVSSQLFRYTYLANAKVRYVGEPVAVVVAEDPYTAEDALEHVEVEYEQIPPVVDTERALDGAAPRLFEHWSDNLHVRARLAAGNFEQASKEADILLSEKIRMHRQAASPMETRGCIAHPGPSGRELTFYCSTQNVHEERLLLAYALNVEKSSLRVVAPDIGGGFGLKSHIHNEDPVVALCSMILRRPVKWTESRREDLLCCHGREQVHNVELAARRNGEILGLRDRVIVDLGAGALTGHGGLISAFVSAYTMPGPYRIKNYENELLAVVTNKAPHGAYRGFGQPEAVFALERMIDILAKEVRLDPVEVRTRNLVPDDDFPYVAATGAVYDQGRPVASLRKALELINYPEFRRTQNEAAKKGRYLGVGMSCYMKSAATPVKLLVHGETPNESHKPAQLVVARDGATVTVDASGKVRVFVAASRIGTGVEDAYSTVAARELGVDLEDIEVVMGDTELCPEYSGVYASRSLLVGGAAIAEACRKLRERMLNYAASLLGVSVGSVEINRGKLRSAAFGKEVSFGELVASLGGVTLESTAYYERPSIRLNDGTVVAATGVYSCGTDVAVVEVDPETLGVKVLKYIVVHDTGHLFDRDLVEGQIVGGVVQGLGGCLQEEILHDNDGQVLTSTLMDYLLPSALDAPVVEVEHLLTPSDLGLYGARAVGESGTIGVAAAVAGALDDALSSYSVKITETPFKSSSLFALTRRRQ